MHIAVIFFDADAPVLCFHDLEIKIRDWLLIVLSSQFDAVFIFRVYNTMLWLL